jgi:glycerol-3-phosphate acyltransferase PlsX
VVSLDGAARATTIAVDAMGGDFAPDEVVKGAAQAAGRGAHVVLVGDSDVVRASLERVGADLPIAHAPDAVGMDEPVSSALRRSGSSLRVALDLVSSGAAGAAVSAGNSGAIMAVALHVLGLQPGIDRPAFGGLIPAGDDRVFVLDIGANPAVKASNLVQFAVMGEVYVRLCLGLDSPRVALLSNGSEDSKGTKSIREANEQLRKTDLNFVGNIEGNEVFDHKADVVVCDGFSGNVLLKTAEGTAMEILRLLKREISRDIVARVASTALMPSFQRVKRQIDFEEHGGAPVLGVDGVMINCHGRSRARAVTNAVMQAEQMARERLVERIGDALHHEEGEARTRRRIARAFHLRSSPT